MRIIILLVPTTLALAACASSTPRPAVSATPPPVRYSPVGLERVLGQDQAGLVALFGEPDAEMREGPARKLQFGSGICVLDAYLYPKTDGLRVTYLDARQRDGSPIDRASCVAALTRRPGALAAPRP